MFNHLLVAPMSERQKEYATESRLGKLGSKLGEDGMILPAYRTIFEQKNYRQRIIPK